MLVAWGLSVGWHKLTGVAAYALFRNGLPCLKEESTNHTGG